MMIYSPDKIINKKKDSIFVFLGGPIQGTTDWRKSMPDIPGITWINPRRENIGPDFDWNAQVEWETLGLRISDLVLFWIPPMTEADPSRDYAQTTRMEFMENLSRGKRIVLGISPGIHAKRYMEYKYGKSAHETLEDCIEEIRALCKKEPKRVYFTSDTHFSSDRALELSKRPFKSVKEMDLTMIERWNGLVKPWDTIYHLGDFGDFKWVDYLNGNIHFLPGNYEKDIVIPDNLAFDTVYQYHEPVLYNGWVLGHEPCFTKSLESLGSFSLFGHIHGRQKIKRFGIDVGVDANNFTPVSEDDVKFYKEAIEKYYDEEVFV